MARLPHTEYALRDVPANLELIFGVHDSPEVRVGKLGTKVAEIPFNPAVHQPTDINPLSVWGEVLDTPHVTEVIPEYPLQFNVVTHTPRQPENDAMQVQAGKQRLASELQRTLTMALPGMTDRVHVYEVGEAADEVSNKLTAIKTDGEPLTDAKTIAGLCKDGLTVVISDFLDLPLENEAATTKLKANKYPATVAVKANHAFDIALPAGIGRQQTGYKGTEINTNKPSELQAMNHILSEQHETTITRLENVGIAAAHIVLQPNTEFGFELVEADQQIAAALKSL